ncbi:MAG: divergent polysaccharide deacetylase family protein [Thiotrichales bacterium]
MRLLVFFVCCVLSAAPAAAGTIALIIDDLGYSYARSQQVLSLHPNITFAVLPNAPQAERVSQIIVQGHQELMLHLPMESLHHDYPSEPTTLTLDMTQNEFEGTVQSFLNRFPQVAGVNNHMGSLLTQHPGHMQWLMDTLNRNQPLYFVDSRTTKASVAKQIADENRVPSVERSVFLDPGESASGSLVWEQIRALDKIADTEGFALAIGHPHQQTISVLRKAIPWLEARGHEIVPVSQYISKLEETPCPECLSPSLKVVKNLKQ